MFLRLDKHRSAPDGDAAGAGVRSAVGELVALGRRAADRPNGSGRTSTVPPAAVMAASADFEKAWALTCTRAGELAPAEHLDQRALVDEARGVERARA